MCRVPQRLWLTVLIVFSGVGCGRGWNKCRSYQEVIDLAVKRGLPGAVMLVDTPDSLWIGSSGFSNVEEETPMQVSDRFRIASVTKIFVAALVLQLVEDGILALNSNLEELLPEIADSISYSSRITIRQLLSHTSGVYNYTDDNLLWFKALKDYSWQGGGPRELVKSAYISRHKSYFEPGKGYHYSNTNYLLLELILESVTDSTLPELLRTRMLVPLNLENTFFERPGDIKEDFVTGYDMEWGQPHDVKAMSFARGMADGGLVSNVKDVYAFSKALFAGALFNEQGTLDTMLTIIQKADYGLGVIYRNDYGLGAFGHEGNWPGYLTLLYYWPEKEVTLILAVNGSGLFHFKRIEKHVLRLIFE